jgi:GNAT superfamily N-acetyltransferase
MNTYSKQIKIIPLSKETLNTAISLIQKIFPYRLDQKYAQRSFSDSLTNSNPHKTYWVAINKEGRVVGTTGLYLDRNDKSVVWLGWFGVHPKHRKQGIGSKLLLFTIDEAKRKGYSLLKLYTSFDKNEKAAHQLYKKFGFVQTKSDKKSDKIYFQKNLR